MKTRDKVMLGGVIALAVVALVLVIVGVLTHTEAGLLTACEQSNGALDPDGDCEEVQWDRAQFPLQVHADTSNPFPPNDPEDAAQSVIDLINGRLGFDALEWTEDPTDADVSVEVGAAQEVGTWMGDANGDARHFRRDDGTLRCEVRTWNTGSLEMLDKALTHEMGHALGLAHDDFEDSAMFGGTLRPDGDRLTRMRLTDHDRGLLRDLYAP